MSDQTPPVGTDQEPVTPPTSPAAEPQQPATPEPAAPALEPTSEPAPNPEPDYKQKFQSSASEAQLLLNQKKVLEQQLNNLTSGNVTEADILAEYSDYYQMNPTTQKVMRDLIITKRKQNAQDLVLAKAEAERRWHADLNALTSQEEYKDLAKDSDFEKFVDKYGGKGQPLDLLADAYIKRSSKPQAPVTPPAPSSPEALPVSKGGPRNLGPKKLSLDEAAIIRKTDWNKYLELVKQGMIDDSL